MSEEVLEKTRFEIEQDELLVSHWKKMKVMDNIFEERNNCVAKNLEFALSYMVNNDFIVDISKIVLSALSKINNIYDVDETYVQNLINTITVKYANRENSSIYYKDNSFFEDKFVNYIVEKEVSKLRKK
jgi:hypothetical protein